MKTKIVFATNNLHKLEEVKSIIGNSIDILSLKDIDCTEEIEEYGKTIEENAKIKAEYVKNKYNINTFADDTGLEVEALNGEPGVRSARYAEEVSHDAEANINKLLCKLKGIENRKAQFKTVIALIYDGKQYLFEGIIKGEIIKEKRGTKGFGYDPVFIPEGYDKTFAELGNEIKNQISHRAIAVKKLCEFLHTLINK
ncbi:MAG: non-canonical purine NTP diphosphatase [Bacteroides sp.]|nr:non-canonical purine NTP diphosphatase [Bacteroides sp.]